jgi:hypothetical protein
MKPKHYYVNEIPTEVSLCQCQNLQLSCNQFSYTQYTLSHIVEFHQKYTNGEWIKLENLTKIIPYGGEVLTFKKFTVGIYYYYIKERGTIPSLPGENKKINRTIREGHLTVRKCCR